MPFPTVKIGFLLSDFRAATNDPLILALTLPSRNVALVFVVFRRGAQLVQSKLATPCFCSRLRDVSDEIQTNFEECDCRLDVERLILLILC